MSRKIDKINQLIQEELSQIILKQARPEDRGIFLTIQEVETAADLKSAKVWVSIFGTKINRQIQEKNIKNLQKQAFGFQKILSQRLDLKFIPKLIFKLDTGAESFQKIDQIIEKNKGGF